MGMSLPPHPSRSVRLHDREQLRVAQPLRFRQRAGAEQSVSHYPPFDGRERKLTVGDASFLCLHPVQTCCSDVDSGIFVPPRSADPYHQASHAEQTHRCQGMPRRPCTLLPGDHSCS